jgi:trimeric autotransporter adhesin
MNNPHSRTKLTSLLAATCLALMPAALAVSPPPDGGYPNENTAEGDSALFNLTTGYDNTAIGFDTLLSNTTGISNTAIGSLALDSNTTGSFNTADGFHALGSNTTGAFNTANGAEALLRNTTGSFNTADGSDTLMNNTTGYENTAIGFDALVYNATGAFNTANGEGALFYNTTGSNNTASGVEALHSNTTGNNNTANGSTALFDNTTGNNNTASGYDALYNNATGSSNIALGFLAGSNLTTGDNNIDIGNPGVAAESGAIRIGTAGTHTAMFVAGVRETPIAAGVSVGISPGGQLGVRPSSARFKDGIKPMEKASEAIFSLQPVTFRYKKALDPEALPQFGLVAEQVAKVDPDLVSRDADGKPFTVRYDEVNAMLLNEFLKAHRKIEEQEASIGELKSSLAQQRKGFESQIAALTADLKAEAAQIQQVSDQLRTHASAPRVVANN